MILKECSHQELPPPSIHSHGQQVTVHFTHGSSSSYHAQWLWHNDPSNIYATSGQRRESPGSYTGAIISQASILPLSDLDPSLQSKYKPGLGCTNPILTYSYGQRGGGKKSSSTSNSDVSNFVLLIHWKEKDAKLTSSALSEDEKKYCRTSMFNMQWLQQWSYDPKSLQSARAKREVTTEIHTFTSKYKKGDKRREAYDGLLSVEYNAIMNHGAEDDDNEQLLYFMDVSLSKK